MKKKRILITAALPYANGYIHLGHLAGAYLPADIYARYQRSKQNEVLFICGSDEHGVAIMVSAEKGRTTPQAIIDEYHPANQQAFEGFGMSFDHYSRTSLPIHHETAKEFFLKLYKSGILREKEEQQLYCETDKMFLADRYVEGTCPRCGNTQARGDQCEQCGNWLNPLELIDPKCILCGTKPVPRATKHLYFPLGDFQSRLEHYVNERNARDGWKENVLRYCESWFKDGLRDRAVTRDFAWGVKVPVKEFEPKVMYVWFEAVLGYISSSKEWALRQGTPDRWRDFWQKDDTKYVAFIGKDNVVFHCIVFPAMLMAYNDLKNDRYVLPENVPANEFMNFEGQKFSKSRGWGIDLRDMLTAFPADMLRYAIGMNLPESRDSDFSLADFKARVNNELADILGNFVNRTATFTKKNFGGKMPSIGVLRQIDREFLAYVESAPSRIGALYDMYKFRDGLVETMNVARAGNKYFNDSEPWKTVTSERDRCATTINLCLRAIKALAILAEPVLPGFSASVWRMLNLPGGAAEAGWESAASPILIEGSSVGDAGILFPKLEDDAIENFVNSLRSADTSVQLPSPTGVPAKPEITIDEFAKVDLRIATVLEAERVKKSDKLIKLQIQIGSEKRQIVAGIGKQYEPEALLGKSIVVVANLKEAKLMGQVSRGMLLAANADDGTLSIIVPEQNSPNGSVVK